MQSGVDALARFKPCSASAASSSANPPTLSASRTAIRSAGVSSITSTLRTGSEATPALVWRRPASGWVTKGAGAPSFLYSDTVILLASPHQRLQREDPAVSNWTQQIGESPCPTEIRSDARPQLLVISLYIT